MLSGKFENCYGIKEFELDKIDFTKDNKAIIYAPNGVMKSSFAKVFIDIAEGLPTCDRIFRNNKSKYKVDYYSKTYSNDNLNKNDEFYVVKSFDKSFETSNEAISTLLADEATRKEYDSLVQKFKDYTDSFLTEFSSLSGISKTKVEKFLKNKFNLEDKSDWTDIFIKLDELNKKCQPVEKFKEIKFSEVVNNKTEDILKNTDFVKELENYVLALENLIKDNELLSENFNDYNAEELGKNLKKHNLFGGKHKIVLRDGTEITTLVEWDREVKKQLRKIYTDDELGQKYTAIKKTLNKNEQTRVLKKIIEENRELLIYLTDIENLTDLFIVTYINNMDMDFAKCFENVNSYTKEIKRIYKIAEKQSERWENVVKEFNLRFKVPFEIKIGNKANLLLKDEAPNLYFTYTRCKGKEFEETEDYGKDELIDSLSMGEQRAMYLLYILFDIELIREKAINGKKYLIIVDDIADSFDYKNKFAIIEYLYDISAYENIDLLILTHNFDFYRTTANRINITRENCYIVQKDENSILKMGKFGYLKDYFSNVIVSGIKSGNINDDEKKKKLISAIPFYRNISQYMLMEQEERNLTCLLHIKTMPINTLTIKLSDIWQIITRVVGSNMGTFSPVADENYFDALNRIAGEIYNSNDDEIILENKILLSIATRLKTEEFLKDILVRNNINLNATRNQTREWSRKALSYLNDAQKEVVNEVNMMTPESIHINSFMYEPIIDMSNWSLKQLYGKVLQLNKT